MDQGSFPPVQTAGFFDKILFFIAGADEEKLQRCPKYDRDNVRAVAGILVCVWMYQTTLFSLTAERTFDSGREILPELILGSAFIATFILLNDSYVVVRSGWHLSGISELKVGGLDISGGISARIKAGLFTVVRIVFAAGISMLLAANMGLVVFGPDINGRIHGDDVRRNAPIIEAATSHVDAQIRQTSKALDAESARIQALTSQVNALRQDQIDPSANRPDVQQANQEVSSLLSEKINADEAVQSAETFASNELGGIRASDGNSGIPGDGPRRHAAMEAVANAKTHAQQIASALDAARQRVDALRKQSSSANDAARQQSLSALPLFERELATEEAKVAALRDDLDRRTNGRDDAIRAAVTAAPNDIPPDFGMLSQIVALDHIAQENPKVAAMIILIDIVSFGLELSAVLAKITSFCPTTYAALVARDSYMGVVRIVAGMMAELDRGSGDASPDSRVPETNAPNAPPSPAEDAPIRPHPFQVRRDDINASPRRPRGRPPKNAQGNQDGGQFPFGSGPAPDAP